MSASNFVAMSYYGPHGYAGYQRYLAAGGTGPVTAYLDSLERNGSAPAAAGPLAAAAATRAPDLAAEIMASAGLAPTPILSPAVVAPSATTDPQLLAFDMAAEIIATKRGDGALRSMSRAALLLAASEEEQIRALAGCFLRPPVSAEEALKEGLSPAAYVRQLVGGDTVGNVFDWEHTGPVCILAHHLVSEGK